MNKQTDWLGKPYYSLDAFFKKQYGEKCYKIAVDAGLSCPNRDGSLDSRGCIFCSKGGSGDFAVSCNAGKIGQLLDNYIESRIEEGIKLFNKKTGDKFVVYFQAYTNTYGSIGYLRKIYEAALSHEKVIGISVATRPDCLSDEVIALLKELREKYSDEKFIWIELGLQTKHEETAAYIRRHYPLMIYDEAVYKLSQAKLPYITHIILGLPGEDEDMMLDTVRYVVNMPDAKPFGIKLQLLHVLKYTDLALDYEKGLFKVLTKEEYIMLIGKCLELIDKDIVIHRLTGDGPRDILIEPGWSLNKKDVLNSLHHYLKKENIVQGSKCVNICDS